MPYNENGGMTMTMPMMPAGYGGGGGFGLGNGGDWIGILFLVGLLGGWGNNGGGLFGGGNNAGAEVQRGFDHSATITKLDGITQGLCDGFYAVNSALGSGFNATQMAIMQGNNALQAQLADCCCTTQRAIDGVNYNLATQACETRRAIQDSTRQVLDFLTQDKIATLTAENQSLKFQASQTAQNGFIDAVGNSIVAQLRMPTPVPAYQVPNPYAGYGYGCNPCGC